MDTNSPDESVTPRPMPEPRSKDKQKVRRVLCIVLVVVLALALGAVSWLYYDAAKDLRERNARIENLLRQIKDLGAVPVDTLPDTDEVSVAACAGGATYAADVGNFTVTLSNPNVIIRTLDANFEGGPTTNLTIGQCIAGQMNVVDNYPTKEVKILAHPSTNAAGLRAAFESNSGYALTAGAPVTVAGVTAQTYTGEGLFNPKLVYFDNAGIGYQIELADTNTTTESVLTDIIADWAFTP